MDQYTNLGVSLSPHPIPSDLIADAHTAEIHSSAPISVPYQSAPSHQLQSHPHPPADPHQALTPAHPPTLIHIQ
jgi:hypothetical protein